MRKLLILAAVLISVVGLSAGGAVFWGYKVYTSPGPLTEDTRILVKPGQGLRQIAHSLQNAGVIEQDWLFSLAARLSEKHTALKAGEYEFAAHISPEGALDKLVRNETVVRSITIPEGLTSPAVWALLQGEDTLGGELGPPAAEGSLLPETYHFSYGDDRKALVRRMTDSMAALRQELWPSRQENLPFKSWEEAVTLASIVEKETALASERPMIARVFINRLRKGMRLQSDPTVVFALTGGEGELGRPLTRQDWKVDNPYNTYVIRGLPPGPIANPGRAALAAVLQPAETDALYFVADGQGGHAFAKTLREHNRNVARWRKIKANGG
ncbi:endolytic transglycosylase MltG [Aestuariispira ectoiniformans]|uniref:endolytic transglycosylase MltG n=1 Tax=Aestuariispira ectoiniformans TaxID=2775080 RepID=UPI00223A71A8|nr:endolytic transglycosylase MltG [Aestuariispira ectoiniformans]